MNNLRDGLIRGWVRVVVARRSGEPPLARAVVILPEGFDPADWASVRSRITGVDVPGNAFTIQTRRGKSLTFQASAETRFRSRRGRVDSLDDLKPGMPVLVSSKDLGGGRYQALLVLAAPRLTR